jgi:predicted HTH transcriptional regulator
MGYCEERGSGITKVIQMCEIFQLPAPKFEETIHATKVTLYSHKTLKQMTKSDKIRACYQHCALKYITDDYMTNASLRNRFKILDKNYSIASRIISETISANLIRVRDQESKAKKHTKYIPYWA